MLCMYNVVVPDKGFVSASKHLSIHGQPARRGASYMHRLRVLGSALAPLLPLVRPLRVAFSGQKISAGAQLLIPAELAHDTVDALGEVGQLQFKDLNTSKSAFQRTYANQVCS